MAPQDGLWGAIARAAAEFLAHTTPPRSKSLAVHAEWAAHTTVATKTAITVARAMPLAVKRLAEVLLVDALHVFPLTDAARNSAESRGVQGCAASNWEPARSARSCAM